MFWKVLRYASQHDLAVWKFLEATTDIHDKSIKGWSNLEDAKLGQDLKPKEIKPSIVNRQYIFYRFSCDLCDVDYVGSTARHLHQRIAEHKYSAIGQHFVEAHGTITSWKKTNLEF